METTASYGQLTKGIGPKITYLNNESDTSYAKAGGKRKKSQKKNA